MRRLLRRLTSAIVITAAIALLLQGCDILDKVPPGMGNNDDENDFTVIQSSGSLRLPIYEYDTMNPLFTQSSSVREVMRLIYEPLFDIKADYTASAVLADGYSVSGGGKKVTVQLKKGVKFHDGAGFSAEDVKYTFDLVKKYKGRYLEYMSDVKSCEAVDEYTVVFNLSRPVANFVSLLTFPIVKNKASTVSDNTFIPNGTGAYKYAGRGNIHEINLNVNEGWRNTLPNIKKITIVAMNDKQAAIYAFGANEVDCITGRAVNLSKYNPKGKNNTYSYTSNDLTLLGMNFYNPIFWGKNTRQAFSYLVDKEYIMKNILYNRGTETDVPVNPDSWYYTGYTRVYSCDPAKAKQLLALDGWIEKEGGGYERTFNGAAQELRLNILVNGENEEKVNIANEIAGDFIDAGIPTGIVALSYADYLANLENKQFDMVICEIMMPNNMDPYMLLSSSGNYFTYSNPDMDKLLEDAGEVTDRQAVTLCYNDICTRFVDDAPFIPLFFREGALICGAKVAGNIRPGPENVFANIDEWYIYTETEE